MGNQHINNSQYGFRTGPLTSHAISDLRNEILTGLDEKLIVCCIFLDLAKAFNTVNHKTLLRKFNCYGIRGVSFQHIQSFLTNRKQSTVVIEICSDMCLVTCGVTSLMFSCLYLVSNTRSTAFRFSCIFGC